MLKYSRYFLLLLAIIITAFILSYYSYSKLDNDRDAMINVAYNFLEVVKRNDTAKATSMLLYGLGKESNEGFTFNVNSAAQMINKFGLPAKEKISLDSSEHNVPTTIAVIIPLYSASNPEDDLQKAVIKVFVQKNLRMYEVVFFSNEFEHKMTQIKP